MPAFVNCSLKFFVPGPSAVPMPRNTNFIFLLKASESAGLYGSERWGNFSYAVPVPEGRYRVTLRFSEGHYGARNTGVGGAGSRLFGVYCNGEALLRKFDILKQASGEGRPADRSFSGIHPNAKGKILLSFVPVLGMACINGIETEEER